MRPLPEVGEETTSCLKDTSDRGIDESNATETESVKNDNNRYIVHTEESGCKHVHQRECRLSNINKSSWDALIKFQGCKSAQHEALYLHKNLSPFDKRSEREFRISLFTKNNILLPSTATIRLSSISVALHMHMNNSQMAKDPWISMYARSLKSYRMEAISPGP